MFYRWIVKFLCIFFVFLVDGAKKPHNYSTRYINDFNTSSIFEPIYDYDNTRTEIDKVPFQQEAATKNTDENLEIYPNPDDIRSRLHHEESVIKIYTTRVRQTKKDRTNRINQTQSLDLNNDDLNGHDFIDSVMFIYYYGKNVRTWKDLGSNIVIIGAGFSIFAQILTLILVALRNQRMRKNAFFPITMNLLVMLFLSNLLFIVGVQSNKNALRCEMIALLLHYLYLTTSVWCFAFIFIIYDLIINESLRLKMRFILLMAYFGPALYVMFSYAASSNSLEYQKYCFMSIHKNMIINFLVPIFILIVATTTLGTLCLKHIKDKNRDILCESVDSSNGIVNGIGAGIILNNGQNIEKFLTDKEVLTSYYLKTSSFSNQMRCCEEQHEDNYYKSKTDIYDSKFDLGQLSIADLSQSSSTDSTHDYTNFKNATKFTLFFQPVFAICWFVGVLALENMQSYVFPTVFAICYNILNWSILLKSRNILPFMKHFYEVENCEQTANEQCEEEHEEEHLERKDSKNMKNNKNLLNQLFLNTNTDSSIILSGSDQIHHRTDQIPLLYQTYNHRKSIANLELRSEYHYEKQKINSRSEHDLVYQAKQQQFEDFVATGNMENLMSGKPGIRSSWDANLDRVSTISN